MKSRLRRSGCPVPCVTQGCFWGTAPHVWLEDGSSFSLADRNRSRSCFQLNRITACPIPQRLVLCVSAGKAAMPFHGRCGGWAAGRRTAHLCGTFLPDSSVWRASAPPHLPELSSHLQDLWLLICSAAPGLFPRPSINIFPQICLIAGICPAAGSELCLGRKDRYRDCRTVGAGRCGEQKLQKPPAAQPFWLQLHILVKAQSVVP